MRKNQFLAIFCMAIAMICMPANALAQVNSGSTGSDGALDFSNITNSTNVVIDMHDHPNGIYQYTYVTIPTNVTVTFVPNASNSPVTWLVQSNVIINGIVDVSGQSGTSQAPTAGGVGGPAGFRGGNGGVTAGFGQGPGGGASGTNYGANASYGGNGLPNWVGVSAGQTYGNVFLIPLIGGSGGGGAITGSYQVGQGPGEGGGGGGGALLIAAANINLSGYINANGGSSYDYVNYGCSPPCHLTLAGAGSGGAIRMVASQITGFGTVTAGGGNGGESGSGNYPTGGLGRIRFDAYDNSFSGNVVGIFTQGLQPIIVPVAGQGSQLTVASVGGVSVSASPTGALSTPDAVLSAQQNNPIPIVVTCANIPLNTQITVCVTPANGLPVSATGYNTAGTQTSSTATISINMLRGGGLVYATAATSN